MNFTMIHGATNIKSTNTLGFMKVTQINWI